MGIASIGILINAYLVKVLRWSRPDGAHYSHPEKGFLVVSAPEQTLQGDPVQRKVLEISNKRVDMTCGFDWKGSSTQDSRDKDVNWASAKDVLNSYWFKSYEGRIKGIATAAFQTFTSIELVCIEGGPISRVEQMEMPMIKMEIEEDLGRFGVSGVDLKLESFKSIGEFEARFRSGPNAPTRRRSAGLGNASPPC